MPAALPLAVGEAALAGLGANLLFPGAESSREEGAASRRLGRTGHGSARKAAASTRRWAEIAGNREEPSGRQVAGPRGVRPGRRLRVQFPSSPDAQKPNGRSPEQADPASSRGCRPDDLLGFLPNLKKIGIL